MQDKLRMHHTCIEIVYKKTTKMQAKSSGVHSETADSQNVHVDVESKMNSANNEYQNVENGLKPNAGPEHKLLPQNAE